MEATAVYPNTVPVLAANGLGVTLAGNDPDHVPLEPDLINDSRRRFALDGSAVDASGVMRLHVRNTLGYAFLRPHQRNKLQLLTTGQKIVKRADWRAQASFYRDNYRHFVPHDLMMDFLENECPPQEDCQHLSKWQGNAIAGVDCGDDGHVMFYPTGHVLQQACAWYSKGELEEDPPCSSTVIETGARIRQFTVMGSRDAYHSSGGAKIFAAARGTTNCTIIAAPARLAPENVRKIQAKANISFPGIINHIAGSPHAEAELALIAADGTIRCWDPEGGIRIVKQDSHMPDRFLRCEYSSHPCVLWAANRVTLSTLDLRQSAQRASKLFDVAGAGTFVTLYDVKRRASNPFQFVVGTGVSIELLDSRMPRQPLVSWIQPQSYTGEVEFSFGAIDEVDLSRNANDSRGYIVSSSKRPKVTTLFPFERNRKRKRGKVMSLTSLRTADDEYSEIPRSSTEQLVASDATLDLRMEDGGEYTHLTGLCALRDGHSASASIYQFNSLGDLYSHQVSFSRSQTKSYRTAVQPDLPSGVTAQDDPADESLSRTLPIPVDAILPEHDTDSMQLFMTLPIKVLRRQFPRLPEKKGASIMEESHEKDETQPAATTGKEQSKKDNKNIQASSNIISRFRSRRVSPNDESKGGETEAASRKSHSETSHDSNESDGGKADTRASSEGRSQNFDRNELIEQLVGVCDPSASLFRLHRYVIEKLKLELPSSKLLLLLRSNSEFRIRTVRHALPTDTLRVRNPSLPGADDVHYRNGDPRLATCTCRPGSADSQLPCESWSCVIPHAVIVSTASPEILLDDTAPSSAVTQAMPQDLADIITAAHAVYDDMYESE
ncbi:DiGeorge syndrome critical region protein 14 [Phytophthora pseudosyringae]|uniref:DiGeorge syndrome critical region protein 14 n=1 Tax=Phytophthora pseudosyringae TaxID=221518 RepID=A0A8T1VWG3_9STRA|nr:DiGeorge syndrome critical region protein 14 [Phytophthora pseudosyringae]